MNNSEHRQSTRNDALHIKAPTMISDQNSFQICTRARRNRVERASSNRSGLAWFCFTRALLRDESGIERLFRSWGGEALYNSHEDDKKTGPTLAALGKPCIVIARQRLVNAWCAIRGIETGDGADFEGCVRADIPGGDIVRIPTLDDPEFRSLTAHDTWDAPLS